MKDEIMYKLGIAVKALNNITVSGKNNLSNLIGCIDILEQMANTISTVEIVFPNKEEKNN